MPLRSGPRLLFVCTGNATRSVIAAALVRRDRPDWPVASAGTWAIPGLPSSRRTLAALAAVDVAAPGHRSTTLTGAHVAEADLIVGFEMDHVRHVRRLDPGAADRTLTLRRLAELDASAHQDSGWRPSPGIATEEPAPWMETPDPAGGDIPDFIACAHAIDADIRRALALLDRW